ncbi:MAG: hypothetical protein IJ995_01025, partial [Clostridia bacterium]|nr:hypothetical protein [Clostridia bacterium]
GQRNQKITSFFHDFKNGRMDEEIERTHPFSLIFNKNGKTGLIPPFCHRCIDINPCKKFPLALGKGAFHYSLLYYIEGNWSI